MPEGPSIVILKETLKPFAGKKVTQVAGNAKIDFGRIRNQKITAFKSWGKHFLICFDGFFLRIHLLLFGTYRINERKETEARLSLTLKKGELNFYNCSIQLMEEDPDDIYDWGSDVMSDSWNEAKALKKIKALKNINVCDVLMNQDIFSGVGNIIKNEVLFRTKIHPGSVISALPLKKLKELVKEAHNYSWEFYEWKKRFELRKHWLVYKKKECPRCRIPLEKDHLGKGKRLTFFCDNCQVVYKN